ncbi:MAG: hypothetical protein Q4C71_06275, partial [Microbacteriaceae bacterium]|nr:hypothetical protein [Microbacteriaceae bacterium]
QQDQAAYLTRFGQLEARYQTTNTSLDEAKQLLARRQAAGRELTRIRKTISQLDPDALAWDEALFHLTTEKITVNLDGKISVKLKNGI